MLSTYAIMYHFHVVTQREEDCEHPLNECTRTTMQIVPVRVYLARIYQLVLKSLDGLYLCRPIAISNLNYCYTEKNGG